MSLANFTSADIDGFAAQLERDGICVLPGVFPKSLIDDWLSAFSRLVDERSKFTGGLAPRGPGRYYVSLPWEPPFCDPKVYLNEVITQVLNRVFAQEYVMVQLAADTPIKGSAHQSLHRDFRPLFSESLPTPLYALAVNFPLVDVTPENGRIEIVRGFHRIPREEAERKMKSGELMLEPLLMNAGDVSIRTPYALHRGSPNCTDMPRPMVVMGYVMHWLYTPKVDLIVPRMTYDELPEKARRLLRCQIVDHMPEKLVESYVEFAY